MSLFARVLLILLLASSMLATTRAQTVTPPDRVDLFTEFVGNPINYDPIDNPSADLSQDTVALSLAIILPASQSIAEINLKCGTTSGSGNIIEKTFVYDVSGTLPDGTTYLRNDNIVYLGLGTFDGITDIYVEVDLEDGSGNHSTTVSTSF